MARRNRTDLKGYFVKNAIPTEQDFGEFIDSVINQEEDGIAKDPGSPLKIEAAGEDTSLKRALNLYRSFSDPEPAWTINLNPRLQAGQPTTARPGFSIGTPQGESRLFINQSDGRLGIGTVAPQARVDIRGTLRVASETNAAETLISASDGNNVITADASRGSGHTIFRSFSGTTYTEHMRILPNGRIGLGTANPLDRLDINGAIRFGHGARRIYGAARVNGQHAVVVVGNWNELEIKGRVIDWTGSNLHIGYANDHSGHYIEMGRNVGALTFFNGDTERMRLVQGRLGIGTISPQAELDVAGDVRITGNDRQLWFQTSDVREFIRFGSWQRYAIGVQGGTQYFRTGSHFAWYKGGVHDDNALNPGGGIVQMVIRDRRVGIGTNDPKASLHIARGEDIAVARPNEGFLILGDAAGLHIAIDNNEIMAKASGTTVSPLHLQAEGGEVIIGGTLRVEGTSQLAQESWKTPTFLNSWVNYHSSYNTAQYFKDSSGVVHLKGLVKNGSGTIFILPAGYRPSRRQLFCVMTSPDAVGRVDIMVDGKVHMIRGNASWLSLDGLTFRV